MAGPSDLARWLLEQEARALLSRLDRVKPFTDDADATYAAAVPLDLQGSGRMRANPDLVAQFQDLARGIERHCDSLITLPGMINLNLYSGVDSPEELASPWMLFLTSEEQQEIADSLRKILVLPCRNFARRSGPAQPQGD